MLETRPNFGRRDIAIILQDYDLLPWKTVEDNIALGLKFRGEKNTSVVEELIHRLGLIG